MREAIGGTWLFVVVVVFVMFFTGYLCLAINYARAYNVKNEVIDIIERNEGYNDEVEQEINDYLADVGYKTSGKCDSDYTGGGTIYEGNKYVYCYKSFETGGEGTDQAYGVYYKVQVFFKIEFPIFEDLFTFGIKGDSIQLYYPKAG